MQYVEHNRGCQPGWLRKVDKWLGLLLPCRCIVCGLAAPATGICSECRAGLPMCTTCCPACGLPVESDGNLACGACQGSPPLWNAVWAAAWYDFPIDRLVQKFKFQRNLAAGKVLASLLRDRLASARCQRPCQVVPVPLHGWRLYRRGFNQAFDIARHICRTLDLTLATHALRRRRHTRHQSGLDARQRQHNLDRAFSWHGPSLAGQRIALVDDVMTTGSTATECARVLKRAGAETIDVWVVARAKQPL